MTEVALDGESVDVYRAELRDTLAPAWALVDAGEGSAEAVQEMKQTVLEMRVPATEKDVHIASVAALHALEAALSTEDIDTLASAQVRFQALAQQAVWLK